jgi:hypothetical protein
MGYCEKGKELKYLKSKVSEENERIRKTLSESDVSLEFQDLIK